MKVKIGRQKSSLIIFLVSSLLLLPSCKPRKISSLPQQPSQTSSTQLDDVNLYLYDSDNRDVRSFALTEHARAEGQASSDQTGSPSTAAIVGITLGGAGILATVVVVGATFAASKSPDGHSLQKYDAQVTHGNGSNQTLHVTKSDSPAVLLQQLNASQKTGQLDTTTASEAELSRLRQEMMDALGKNPAPYVTTSIQNHLARSPNSSLTMEQVKAKIESKNRVFYPYSMEEFHKDTRGFTPDKMKELYSHAYIKTNPYIYEPAPQKMPLKDYALNFMWINKSPLQNAKNFLGTGNDVFESEMVNKLKGWVNSHPPGAAINFWYDSQLLDETSLRNSKDIFDDKIGKDKVTFRDIRAIDVVKTNPQMFADNIPVYFRVDFLKAITGDHTLRNDGKKYAVNIDVDIEPIGRDQMFDARSLRALNTTGALFGAKPLIDGENSFILMHNSSSNGLLETHRKEVIDHFVERYNKGLEIEEQDVFLRYREFRTAMEQKANKVEFELLKPAGKDGKAAFLKPLNFPDSKFSTFSSDIPDPVKFKRK